MARGVPDRLPSLSAFKVVTLHQWCDVLTTVVFLWLALACGVDGDKRMVRRYAECMVDPNTTLYRLTVSEAVGTVPLSPEAVEERLYVQLSRGKITMAEIRADHGRYCE